MEHNTVILSLEVYDKMKQRITDLENELSKEREKFAELKIFKCTTGFSSELSLDFADDAKQFIDKAFEPFADSFEINILPSYAIWHFGIRKKLEAIPEAVEEEPSF